MTRCGISLDLWQVYGSTVLVEFGFGWHTDSYRLAVYGGGAFELCLPSLGFFLTKLTLRCRFWVFADRMTRLWGEEAGGRDITVCNIMPF